MGKFYDVSVAATGEIRVGAQLFPEEQRFGVVLRGFSVNEALDMAAQLLKAAEQVGELERRSRDGQTQELGTPEIPEV